MVSNLDVKIGADVGEFVVICLSVSQLCCCLLPVECLGPCSAQGPNGAGMLHQVDSALALSWCPGHHYFVVEASNVVLWPVDGHV